MRILICIPHDLKTPRGNSIAALRLTAGFETRGHRVWTLENCETQDGSEAIQQVRPLQPDIVFVMHAWRCAAAFHAARSAMNVPVIVSLRGTDSNEMMEDEDRGPVIRSVLERCDGIAVFSETTRHRVVKYSSNSESKISVIPNGLELSASHSDYRQRLGIDRNTFVIVGLAGIRQAKRILWLLNMLSQVRARGHDFIYLHGGPILEKKEGEMFRYLCDREPWMRYEGIIPHEEVASFLRAGDLFVSASRSEGMPHAVREAMFVGLPCLLSDIEGHGNMARDGIEALFFSDEESFSKKLTRLMKNRILRRLLAESGRNRIENELVRGGEVDSYLALFTALTQNKVNSTSKCTT
jgi:glycosyltransferase involved in cell wall biosynthesis